MPDKIAFRSLFDIQGLSELRTVCRLFSIQITAFGSVLRRLLASRSEKPDLFELSPFMSDIDFVHTGRTNQTPKILDAIYAHLPLAECFRWELRSVKEYAVYEQARRTNRVTPANLMSLSTDPSQGFRDPWDGERDIRDQKFRYVRNGFYEESPLYKAGRDLEIFSALLYFRVLLEANIVSSMLHEQPGWEDARRVVEATRNEGTIIALQERAYLRARLRYLLKGLTTAARSSTEIDHLASTSGLHSTLTYIDNYLTMRGSTTSSATEPFVTFLGWGSTPLDRKALVISARVGGNLFRLPHRTELWEIQPEAGEKLMSALRASDFMAPETLAVTGHVPPGGTSPGRTLGEGQNTLLASPLLPVRRGQSASSRTGSSVDEFIHFAIPLDRPSADQIRGRNEEDLTAVVALTAEADQRYTSFFCLPAVCGLRAWGSAPPQLQGQLLTIRINCLQMLELAYELCAGRHIDAEPHIQVFVLGCIPDEG